jgi:hypothetical protein
VLDRGEALHLKRYVASTEYVSHHRVNVEDHHAQCATPARTRMGYCDAEAAKTKVTVNGALP